MGSPNLLYLRVVMRCKTIHSLTILMVAFAIRGVTGQEPVGPVCEGLKVSSFPNKEEERFGIVVMVGVGSRDDAPVFAGAANFLERVISRTPTSHSGPGSDAGLISRRIRQAGGTYLEHTLYQLSGKVEDWRFMVDWIGDRITRPCFSVQHVDYERDLLLTEIRHAAAARFTTIESELYPGHPLARPVAGRASSVQQISMTDLRMVHRQYYHSGNIVIGFSGGGFDEVANQECTEAIRSAFADLPVGVRDIAEVPPVQCVGTRLLFPERGHGRGGWLLTGFHLMTPNESEATASPSERMARLHVLTSYLSRRFAAFAREDREDERSSSVDLVSYRDLQRLDFVSKVRDASDMDVVLSRVDALLNELSLIDTPLLERVKEDRASCFTVRSADELAAAVKLTAWLNWEGADPDEYIRALATVEPATLTMVASSELRSNLRFTLSDVPRQARDSWWRVLLTLLLVMFTIDWFNGFKGSKHLALALAWPFQRCLGVPRSSATPGMVDRVDADQIEREFQRYFEEEDRTRGGR